MIPILIDVLQWFLQCKIVKITIKATSIVLIDKDKAFLRFIKDFVGCLYTKQSCKITFLYIAMCITIFLKTKVNIVCYFPILIWNYTSFLPSYIRNTITS